MRLNEKDESESPNSFLEIRLVWCEIIMLQIFANIWRNLEDNQHILDVSLFQLAASVSK